MRKVILGAVLVCTAAAGGWQFLRTQRATAAQLPPTRDVQTEHTSEQAWIVDDIAEAILAWRRHTAGEAAGSARTVPLAGGAPAARFQVTVPPGTDLVIAIDDHIWSPEAYAPLVKATLGPDRLPPGAPPGERSLSALSHPSAEVIQAENLRVSGILQGSPHSADAHEEAALVLAALALRETAGDFSDPRRIMSRLTAHLAIARHLRAAQGVTGRVADAALLTLAGRQRDALTALDRIDAANVPAATPWVRALRLRNTTDWRRTREAPSLTLLEQLETLRAIQSALGSDGAMNYIDRMPSLPATTSWMRILLHGRYSVEAGNSLIDVAVGAEANEARTVAETFDGGPAMESREQVIAALNAAPAAGSVDAVTGNVRIIDWGLWAAASQRHLLMHLHRVHQHLDVKLGLREDAKTAALSMETFSDLTLYPLLRRYVVSDAPAYDQALDGAVAFTRARPELVPFQAWQRLFHRPDFWQGSLARVPPLSGWFTPITPAGTAFEIGVRAFDSQKEGIYPRIPPPEIARFREIAPYARMIVMANVVGKHGGYPPHTVLQQEYGEFAEYDLILARRVARFAAADPNAYVPLMRRVGALDPSELSSLGAYLADRGRPGEAQQVYEEWLAKSRDQVEVANGAWWLVRRYYQTKEFAKAAALAQRVASVHSYGGLLTLADLHEWRGELSEARELYRTAAARYDNYIGVLAFAMRHGERSGIPDAESARLQAEFFPNGVQRVAVAELAGDPALGVSLLEVGETGRKAGLRNNDIIVAVDGIRVENEKHYRIARAAVDSPDMTVTVWRKGQYLEIRTPLRFDWPVQSRREYVHGKTPVVPFGKPD